MSKNKEILSDKEKRDVYNRKSTMKAIVLKKPCSAEERKFPKSCSRNKTWMGSLLK